MEKNCKVYKQCGGCSMQDKDYKKQLEVKTKNVRELMAEVNRNIRVKETIGMKSPLYYRNKAKYVFGYKKQTHEIQMGFFTEGTHKIINCEDCIIQNKIANEVANFTFELVKKYRINIYNEDARKGFLRHLIIRVGTNTKEIMVIFVTTNSKMFKREVIIKELVTKFPNIKTIVQDINEKETNAILGDKNIKLYGNGYIMDTLGEYKFKISPLSFYQVNPVQTQVLYNTAIKYADLKGSETVCDLYSGIGTISLFVSKYVSKVFGIEIVKDAVKDAIENAKINKIRNVEFISGRVEVVLPKMCRQGIKPDVIFVDPPRSGLDKKTIETIIEIKPKKVIYISCNPETLAENLKKLSGNYVVKEVQPVDMFPYTSHVESVVLLSKN